MDKVKCVCRDCGKKFNKGDEGDNEQFCLRCEHLSVASREDDDFDPDYEYLDEEAELREDDLGPVREEEYENE